MADNLNYTNPGSGVVVAFRDNSSVFHQRCDAEGKLAHDADATAVQPILVGGFASAAAPSDVSADADAVKAWFLRNGAQVVQSAFAGVLATTGNGASGTGVQRVTLANDSTGILATVSTVTTLTTLTGGGVAHDAGDSGNPLKVGAKAKASTTGVTLVAADDRTDVFADLDGTLVQRPQCPLGDLLSERVTDTGGTSTNCAGAFAATASQRIYLATVIAYNDSTTNGYVDIRDGSGGSVLATLPLPAKGGSVINLPLPLRFSSNTAVAYDVSAALSTVYLTFIGFKSKA